MCMFVSFNKFCALPLSTQILVTRLDTVLMDQVKRICFDVSEDYFFLVITT